MKEIIQHVLAGGKVRPKSWTKGDTLKLGQDKVFGGSTIVNIHEGGGWTKTFLDCLLKDELEIVKEIPLLKWQCSVDVMLWSARSTCHAFYKLEFATGKEGGGWITTYTSGPSDNPTTPHFLGFVPYATYAKEICQKHFEGLHNENKS